jgi:hypothetical protein
MPVTARASEAGCAGHVRNRVGARPEVVHRPADDAAFPQAARERADRVGTVGDFVDNGGGVGGRADYGAFGGAGLRPGAVVRPGDGAVRQPGSDRVRRGRYQPLPLRSERADGRHGPQRAQPESQSCRLGSSPRR